MQTAHVHVVVGIGAYAKCCHCLTVIIIFPLLLLLLLMRQQGLFIALCVLKMSVLAALCFRAYRPFKAIVINNKFVIAASKRKATPAVPNAITPIASQAIAPTAVDAAVGGGMGSKLSVRSGSSLRIGRTVSHEGAPLIVSDLPESQRLKARLSVESHSVPHEDVN
jgi:hypothetical protein